MKQIKTKLEFLDEFDKRIIKIKHSEDIEVFVKNRKNHQKIYREKNLKEEYVDYIVILIPKSKISKGDIKRLQDKIYKDTMLISGFQCKEIDECYEISGYNKVSFAHWIVPELRNITSLNKKDFSIVSEFVLPIEKGRLGSYNYPTFFQTIYNFLGLIVELWCSFSEKFQKQKEK